jgi:hypothetical protein
VVPAFNFASTVRPSPMPINNPATKPSPKAIFNLFTFVLPAPLIAIPVRDQNEEMMMKQLVYKASAGNSGRSSWNLKDTGELMPESEFYTKAAEETRHGLHATSVTTFQPSDCCVSEPERLRSSDVGITWQPLANHSKFGLRLLLYSLVLANFFQQLPSQRTAE